MSKSAPKPPAHLSAATRRWWSSVAADFELEPHHLRLLTLAGEAWDRCVQAREQVALEGIMYRNRFNEPRPHPAVAIERDSRLAFARMIREIGLDGTPDPDPRPPGIGGRYA